MKKSKRFKALQRYLGVVFQENIIFNRLSVLEHLELWGAFKGISDNNLKDSIDYYAENLQLNPDYLLIYWSYIVFFQGRLTTQIVVLHRNV